MAPIKAIRMGVGIIKNRDIQVVGESTNQCKKNHVCEWKVWKSEANKDTCERFNSLLSTSQNISKMNKDILTGSELVNLS